MSESHSQITAWRVKKLDEEGCDRLAKEANAKFLRHIIRMRHLLSQGVGQNYEDVEVTEAAYEDAANQFVLNLTCILELGFVSHF